MTLYYSLCFALLVAEMALFVLLICPLPHVVKRKLFNFLAENPLVSKIQYGLKITFIFVLILFIDAVNRVYRVQIEMGALSSESGRAAAAGTERMEVQARKFYSQRNMYLTGFTIFLSLILNRTYIMILETLRLEEKVKLYEGDKSAGGKEGEKLSVEYRADQIGKLNREVEKKDKEIEAMKSQSKGLQREYDELVARYAQQNPPEGIKKSN